MKLFLLILLPIFIISCHKGTYDNCNGDTRREVKLLIDGASSEINFSPIVATIDSLENISATEPHSDTPRMSVEKQVYTVTGEVQKVKRYHDGDYHVRLKVGDSYINTEVPNPDCKYLANSTRKDLFRDIVSFIQTNDLEGKTVTVTGVAFIDINHHYKRKQAKNNIELHPILDISM